MKKLRRLTLIELLISMAIFSVMMTLLIKSFQLATDVSSNSESTIKVLEKSQLSLNLLSTELKQALTRSSKSWINAPNSDGVLVSIPLDKSLSFSIDVNTKSITFFKPSEESDKIYVVQYRHNSSGSGEKGLIRYEKELDNNFVSDRKKSYNQIDSKIADSNNLIAHIGLKDYKDISSEHRLPPDLFESLDSDNSITADLLIPEDEIESFKLSYSLDRYSYDKSIELKKGEKPDYITVSLSLKSPNNLASLRSFSRKISLNGN